jgi:ABC-2 type transport system permease protein
VGTAERADAGRTLRAIARQRLRDGRVSTLAFASVFGLYAAVQPVGYRHAYPTAAERLGFARSFAGNVGLRLFYGEPHDVATVTGYAAWRVGGTLAVAAAAYGLFAAVRAQRAEEDAGRAELLLAGPVGRRTLALAAVLAVGAGALTLWLAELAGLGLGGVPLGGAAYLALATASVVPVCAGVGALAGQLAPTRRLALELGGALVGALFLLRAVADTTAGLGWLRWATPLGWAEELRPFAGPRPLVLLLPASATFLLALAARMLAARRDVGAGILPVRDTADPHLLLLSSPWLQAFRTTRGTLLAWVASAAVFGYVLGAVSTSISPADVSKATQAEIARLGAGSITTPAGYLGFVFLFFVLAVAFFACAQVGAARQEEAGQLETLLALPVARGRWLAGRLALAAAAAAVLSLATGLATWAGAATAGADVALPRLLEAGANALPAAYLFLGLAALAYAVAPGAGAPVGYGLVAVTFLWQLVGALLGAPRWLVQATPFAHVALVPAQPFRPAAAALMLALGAAAALAALAAFRARDLAGG